ncbi:MAG: disulfide oxidoreductase [delta proteobacterium ML8_F1]|nr:MAG: disulfide oxidoreductase [delta proteobacterium ML8_F1]
MKIEKNMTIAQLIQSRPESVSVLLGNGMGCIGCPASQAETIEQASLVHGIDLERLMKELKDNSDEGAAE